MYEMPLFTKENAIIFAKLMGFVLGIIGVGVSVIVAASIFVH